MTQSGQLSTERKERGSYAYILFYSPLYCRGSCFCYLLILASAILLLFFTLCVLHFWSPYYCGWTILCCSNPFFLKNKLYVTWAVVMPPTSFLCISSWDQASSDWWACTCLGQQEAKCGSWTRTIILCVWACYWLFWWSTSWVACCLPKWKYTCGSKYARSYAFAAAADSSSTRWERS